MTVRNKRSTLIEELILFTPDGEEYILHDPPWRAVTYQEGWGIPQTVYQRTRSPFQHGESVLSHRLQPRTISVSIFHEGKSRDRYWENREAFVDALRYSRTPWNTPEPLVLRRITSRGDIYEVEVFLRGDPVYIHDRNRFDQWYVREDLTFYAPNPILYAPTGLSATLTGDDTLPVGNSLILPTLFPIDFSIPLDFRIGTADISYSGTWEEYPLITMGGPGTKFEITHLQTGKKIVFEREIVPPEVVIFDLRFGVKEVKNNSDVSLIGFIDQEESDLGTFALQPDPIVEDGLNSLQFVVRSGSASSFVLVEYYTRYIGI